MASQLPSTGRTGVCMYILYLWRNTTSIANGIILLGIISKCNRKATAAIGIMPPQNGGQYTLFLDPTNPVPPFPNHRPLAFGDAPAAPSVPSSCSSRFVDTPRFCISTAAASVYKHDPLDRSLDQTERLRTHHAPGTLSWRARVETNEAIHITTVLPWGRSSTSHKSLVIGRWQALPAHRYAQVLSPGCRGTEPSQQRPCFVQRGGGVNVADGWARTPRRWVAFDCHAAWLAAV